MKNGATLQRRSASSALCCIVSYKSLCAEDKKAHRQEELEGKALKVNPTLKHLVRHMVLLTHSAPRCFSARLGPLPSAAVEK